MIHFLRLALLRRRGLELSRRIFAVLPLILVVWASMVLLKSQYENHNIADTFSTQNLSDFAAHFNESNAFYQQHYRLSEYHNIFYAKY